jgi:hypothetical protein
MFGLFNRKPTIHIALAESAATTMAKNIENIPIEEVIQYAPEILRSTLQSLCITEELRDQEYREISQLACQIKLDGGQYNMDTVRSMLKSFT